MEMSIPNILYKDKHILLCEKPAGMPSQPGLAGNKDLLTTLNEQYPSAKLIHRLDTPTGGVMVYGLSQVATAKMGMMIQDHQLFCKEYFAIVEKTPENTEGELFDYLFHDKRQNKSFVAEDARKGAKPAKLYYRTTAVHPNGTALLSVKLQTGRTHQIRVQFASRGMPLVGDGKYGSRVKAPNIGLWAYRLSFPHPITGKPLSATSIPEIQSAPWSDYSDILKQYQFET